MLNFDEQTGIGVLMIVWSFLVQITLHVYMKTQTIISIQLTILVVSDFRNNDTLSRIPLSLFLHKPCNATIKCTLQYNHFQYSPLFLLYAYQHAQSTYLPISNLSKTTWGTVLYDSCMSLPFLFSFWHIRPSFASIDHFSLYSVSDRKENETHVVN